MIALMEAKLSQPDAKVLHFEKILMLFKFKVLHMSIYRKL